MNSYKNILLSLACYLSTSLTALAMPPDPLLHYDFDASSIKTDNIVRDSSGNNLHAVFAETDTYTSPRQTLGYQGGGLTFDGTGLLRIGDHNLLDLNTHTAMAWVRYQDFAANDGRQEIYEKANSYWMNIRKGSRRLRIGGIFGACTGANRNWFYLDSLSVIPKNIWTHVAARYNGGSLAIYINGQLDAQAPVSGRICDSDQPLILAAKHQLETLDTQELILEKPEAFLKGTLDEFRLYDVALSQSQIQQVMNSVTGLSLATTLTTPAKNASVTAPVNISGSATAPDRLSQVLVGIKDNVTNKWWRNGNWGAWQLNPATLNFTNSNQTSANFSFSFDPRGTSGSGNYWVVVRAVDLNGSRSDPKSSNFTVSNN